MKQGIHPKYEACVVKCACGETFETQSIKPELRVEVCSKCHPFYTGSQKNTIVGGRSERFKKKFGITDNE
jgi:large subunit ribosomal protein L31